MYRPYGLCKHQAPAFTDVVGLEGYSLGLHRLSAQWWQLRVKAVPAMADWRGEINVHPDWSLKTMSRINLHNFYGLFRYVAVSR